jgi:hypothetical protein
MLFQIQKHFIYMSVGPALQFLVHGRLTAEAAAERIVAEIGLGRQAARDEVDGFLQD